MASPSVRWGEICGSDWVAGLSAGKGWLCWAGSVAQIPKETIEQILAATDIVDLISSYIPVKRAGTQFKANCPFHHEKTPSFSISPTRQSFKCFGCGKGGSAIGFVMEHEGLPFVDAVRRLATRAGIIIREEVEDAQAVKQRRTKGRLLDLHREAAAFFHERLMKDPQAQHARDYLKGRGFGAEMAERWTVGWMPENSRVFLDWARGRKFTGRELVAAGLAGLRDEQNPQAGVFVRFRDRLMFSIRNEVGDVIAFSGRQLKEDPNSGKYINSPETAIFRKSNVLFALDRAKKAILKEKSVLLCEGQIDAISCHELGVENAIAPLGTAFTQQHARLIKRYANQVLMCYDADRAGLAATERAFRELAPEGLEVRVVEMPAGDDPDTYLKAHGIGAFRGLMAAARDFFDFKLERAKLDGLLETSSGRTTLANECAELLALMGDPVAVDQQINIVATRLQTSAAALREAIVRARRQPKRSYADPAAAKPAAAREPTELHRIVAYLCQLALSSVRAQHYLGEQFETLHEAKRWVSGISLLERILGAGPDPASPTAVNSFLASLPEADQLALMALGELPEAADDAGLQAAEEALASLSATVLHRRDAAVKAALKEPGLPTGRLRELLEEAKEISSLLRGVGQRSEFDDDLPPSTFKPKPPPWRRW